MRTIKIFSHYFEKKKDHENSIFIVVGRLGKNLIVSKTLPVVACGLFAHIYVFSEDIGIEMEGVDYIILPKFVRKLKPNILKKIIRIIYEPIHLVFYALYFHPSVIHGYYSIPKGLNSLIAAKFSRSKCIISIIGGKEEIETTFSIKLFSRPLIIWLLKQADHITTKGKKDNEYLIKYKIKENSISIFNGAIDMKRFCYNGEAKDIDILFAGYFDESKGPHRALQIIRRVILEIPTVKVFFIGIGPMYKIIREDSVNLGLSNNITFTGHVNNPEYYFKHSNILIFPSANEGLSTAMLEAMSCRCVPITSDVGNQTEAAIHDYNSLVVNDYNNLWSFSENAITLLKDHNRWARLSENAEKTIFNNYSQDFQGQICHKFYSQLIQKR